MRAAACGESDHETGMFKAWEEVIVNIGKSRIILGTLAERRLLHEGTRGMVRCLGAFCLMSYVVLSLANAQTKEYVYLGKRVLGFEGLDPAVSRAPSLAYRDSQGYYRVVLQTSSLLSGPSSAAMVSNPAIAQNAQGDSFVAGRDQYGALALFTMQAGGLTWGTSVALGGLFQGDPAVAFSTGAVYVAARDTYAGSYWLYTVSPVSGDVAVVGLGGIFASDPTLTACPNGDVYLIGRDTYNSLWANRVSPGLGPQGWTYGAGITQGRPSAACGTDNTVYIATRDTSGGTSWGVN